MKNVMVDYRTRDLYLAAYLKSLDIPFLGTSKVSGKTYFIFETSDNISELKNDFFSRRGKVSALDYADELRALKTLFHS